MFRSINCYEGEGTHIYRSIAEIKDDIEEVSDKISEINSMLNIRHLLMGMLTSAAEEKPDEWIPELCELVEGAKESLDALAELNETLQELNLELEDTKCEMGI